MTAQLEGGQAQRRILQVVLTLAGNELMGLAPSEIQRALQITSASTVTRDLGVLKDLGIAEQIQETGRWRLGPRLVQVAIAHLTHMEKAEKRLSEIRQRFSREP
jgi:DNA-binding IclR family transcriptional regulator